jgi:hypothetical protein
MRPPEVTQSLPHEYRWEFTRRHPYYLRFWEAAHRHHQQQSLDPEQRAKDEIASLILASIGVESSLCPPDPRLGPEAIGQRELGRAWESGAVAPATFRALGCMLFAALPPAQRSQLGRLLIESSEFDLKTPQMVGLLQRFMDIKDPVWDSFPASAPVISINLQMPQRAIGEAVENLVRQWKEEHGIAEHRRRDDKLEEYLLAWDLREGWHDGGYDGIREQLFKQIAEQTMSPISTAISRYQKAFYYVWGFDFSAELWIRLMGPAKLSRFSAGVTQGLSRRRRWRSPNLRPVAASVVQPRTNETEGSDFLNSAGVTSAELATVDLALDIETLLDRGKSDNEIIAELELEPQHDQELLDELRRRHELR